MAHLLIALLKIFLLGAFLRLVLPNSLVRAETLNVLAIGFFSRETSRGLEWFTGPTASLAAVFPIAMKHFNERDGRIIPQFATRTCNLTIDLLEYVDDQGSPAPATRRLVAVQNKHAIDVIIGPVRSAVAQPIAVTASALKIPVVSHWATIPDLANKQTYPYFSRTCPSDDARAILLVDLLVTLGFKKFGMLYVNDNFGIGWRNAIISACDERNIDVVTAAYDDATGPILKRAIDQAMAQLQRAKLNVIFYIIGLQAENLYYLASAARAYGMLGPSNLYVHTINDLYFAENDFPQDIELLRDFMDGSIRMINSVTGIDDGERNLAYESFRKEWPNFKEADVNPTFPPANPAISKGEKFFFPAGYFRNTTNDIFNVFTWSYDVVATVGLAACNMVDAKQDLRNSTEMLRAIREIEFQGVSGLVKYDHITGDRDPFTSVYILSNVQLSSTNELINTKIGWFLPSFSEWRLDLSKARFRSGTSELPSDVQIPYHEMNLLPNWAKILGYIETSIGLGLGIASIVWLLVRKHELVVKQSQPVFMGIIASGVLLLSLSIIPLTIEFSDQACMAFPFLFALGLTLIASSISMKSLRVGRLWYRVTGRRNDRGRWYLIVILFAVIVNLAILLTWNYVAPLVYQRLVTDQDINGLPKTSYGACVAINDTTFVFLGLEVAILALLIVVTGLLSVWVYNAPEKFQDARFTAIAACCLAQVYLLGVPIVVLTYTFPLTRFLVLSTLCFLTAIVLLCFLFIPKLVRARSEKKNSSEQNSPPGTSLAKNKSPGRSSGKKVILMRFSPIPMAIKQRANHPQPNLAPVPLDEEGDVRSKAKAHRSDFIVNDIVENPKPLENNPSNDVTKDESKDTAISKQDETMAWSMTSSKWHDWSNIEVYHETGKGSMHVTSPSIEVKQATVAKSGDGVQPFNDNSVAQSSTSSSTIARQGTPGPRNRPFERSNDFLSEVASTATNEESNEISEEEKIESHALEII